MVTFKNFGSQYQPSVHYGRQNIANRYEQHAEAKRQAYLASHCYGGGSTTITINQGPSKEMLIGSVIGQGLSFLGSLFSGIRARRAQRTQQQYVMNQYSTMQNPQLTSTQPRSSSTVPTSTLDKQVKTVQDLTKTETIPATSDIDISKLPSGSSVKSVSSGYIGGGQSFVATIQKPDGSSETYALTKDSAGKYQLGAKVSQTSGNNYVNQDKLDAAIKKEFGEGFELPQGFSADLVNDTLVIKDDKGNKLSSEALFLLKNKDDPQAILDESKKTTDAEDAESMLKSADGNGDNVLNKDEYKQYMKTMLKSFGIEETDANKEKFNELLENSFTQIDTNPDGTISKEELEKNASAVMDKLAEDAIDL